MTQAGWVHEDGRLAFAISLSRSAETGTRFYRQIAASSRSKAHPVEHWDLQFNSRSATHGRDVIRSACFNTPHSPPDRSDCSPIGDVSQAVGRLRRDPVAAIALPRGDRRSMAASSRRAPRGLPTPRAFAIFSAICHQSLETSRIVGEER